MSDHLIASGEVAAKSGTAAIDPLGTADPIDEKNLSPQQQEKVHSLWGDAWGELKRNWMFWVSAALILVFLLMAIVPGLFTRVDPTICTLTQARKAPSAGHIFGTNLQGCDVFSRTIHGARSSILVGVLATLGTTLLGSLIGIIAGYFGGWVDTLLSRVGDIFFALPLLLGALILLFTFPNNTKTPYFLVVFKVVIAIVLLGWPGIARLMRSSVLQVKPLDYVQAARALGARPGRIIFSHVLPNALAPVIVVATINLGAYIATEATLSFLGIGLQYPAISWGIDISESSAIGYVRAAPHMLLFPALFLSLAVLAFILMGEAIRDALDPKLR